MQCIGRGGKAGTAVAPGGRHTGATRPRTPVFFHPHERYRIIGRMSTTYQPSEIRRNYRLLLAEGILFTVGLVFFDPNTVLPLLMERLTGSAVLVGLVGAVQPLAKGITPILAGNWISSLAYKKRFLVLMMSIGRLPLWILALSLIWIPDAPAFFWAGLLLIVQMLFWFGDSAGDPAWIDMVGKAVPSGRRGRFFAIRQVIGGVLSVAAGAAVAAILAAEAVAFPVNYGLVVCIGALLYLANVGTFVGLVERPSPTSRRLRIITLVRTLPHYLRANGTFGTTMIVLILFNMSRLSLPFYVVFAIREFGLDEGALAVFLPLQMVGRIVGAVIWGHMGDRHGHQRAIKVAALICAAPPLIAIGTGLAVPVVPAMVTFGLLFLVLGLSLAGWPPFMNYVLDIVPDRERPLYAGLMGIGNIPAALAPVAGGLLIQTVSYPALFGITALLTVAGFLVALSLPVPQGVRVASRGRTRQNTGE